MANVPKGRVTLKKVGGGYDINIAGRGVSMRKTKAEAESLADYYRKRQGKYRQAGR